jgi:diguanylate cyclase (GGDEF)-like protein
MAVDTTYALPIALIISKEANTLKWFKKALKATFRLVDAQEKEMALDKLSSHFIEMIIIDEPCFSLELCKTIRNLKGYQFIPILLITGNLKKTFLFQALNAGVSDFINEPLDEKEVLQRFAVAMKAEKVHKKTSRIATRIKEKAPEPAEELKERFLLNDVALKEIAKAKKNQQSLSMLMIEMDDYSTHLAKWGDAAAEEISQEIHSRLKEQLRQLDTLFPQGGGRFILLLPKTSERAAHLIAENIRSEVSSHPIKTKKGSLSPTVSIGLVSYDQSHPKTSDPYQHFDQMLEAVSRALVKAKKKGNKIISGDLT